VAPADPPPAKSAAFLDDGDDHSPDFTGFALWMAASLAGLVTAALLSHAPAFRALARRFGWIGPAGRPKSTGPARKPRSAKPNRRQALPLLADAIVGNTKSSIARVFGPPHSAVLAPAAAQSYSAEPPDTLFWQADTWYYPLPRNGQLAMAIQFGDDLAQGVEFLRAPGA
jgi:hypothetical protein